MPPAPTLHPRPLRVRRRPHEELRLCLEEYRGHEFVDVRAYFEDDDGAWHPSRRGVTVSLDAWPDFVDAVGELDDRLRAEGMIAPTDAVERRA